MAVARTKTWGGVGWSDGVGRSSLSKNWEKRIVGSCNKATDGQFGN